MSRYPVWKDRYATGWQLDDGTLEYDKNFDRKWSALSYVMGAFNGVQDNWKGTVISGFVHDSNLRFSRWYYQGKWTRQQPEPPLQHYHLHTGPEEHAE